MKKSRIIVPALALLCLSTAATISGSVAWFTANRTFNTTVSSFHVARLDGNLACTMDTFGESHATAYGASYNATPLNSDGHVNEYISVETGAQLLNASYDHVNNKLFYSEDGGATILEKTSVADWKHDRYNNVNYYYAVKWQMTFTFHYTIDVTPQELYFDAANSSITAADAEQGHTSDPLQAKKGFRMAFIGTSEKVVWAPLEDETATRTIEQQQQTVDLCTFILNGATTPANYSTEGNGDLVAQNTTGLVAKDVEAAYQDNLKKNYLGTFANPVANQDSTLTLTAVAWFEGTDENIVDNSYIAQTITANMNFFVHKHVANS